ncbi:MAG TPA: ParB/RepB/Spo0J family partition protein [Candidatus Polarisedimenticolaceae bacterium]|nr:ParB/RepB/Spo0J family partition protein [Candidatus Polarisedimenticolaceae bacterium]
MWPNPAQPRTSFDEERLDELARSIKNQGVLQPIVVRPGKDGAYELIAGERRWRAAQMAGLLKIPAVVRETGDSQLRELALIENLQRDDLDPIEEAAAYQALIDEADLTQQDVADRVGKSRATVANALRLLNLPAEVQQMIRDGQLSAGHAKALLGLASSTGQIELARRIVSEGLTVRSVESRLRRSASERPAPAPAEPRRDPNVVAAEQQLQKTLGTKVRILQRPSGAGRLEIHFFSGEELERVFELLSGTARGRG